jgi:mono/diheme cytochrome c family protein
MVLGAVLLGLVGALLGGPIALAHHHDLPLEHTFGSAAVGSAAKLFAGSAQNPIANNPRAAAQGRSTYIGACAQCHGADGTGQGIFGQLTYPPAADLTSEDVNEKSDAALFWIVKYGLSFTGMPGFGGQYADQDIWALVSYVRTMHPGQASENSVPAPPAEQLAFADPAGNTANRGAAVYFAQGCASCHSPVGNAPGELGLRQTSTNELTSTLRRGRSGMPAYNASLLSDTDVSNKVAYMGTFAPQAPRSGGDGGEGPRPGRAPGGNGNGE